MTAVTAGMNGMLKRKKEERRKQIEEERIGVRRKGGGEIHSKGRSG
jgi:hypothetical protein